MYLVKDTHVLKSTYIVVEMSKNWNYFFIIDGSLIFGLKQKYSTTVLINKFITKQLKKKQCLCMALNFNLKNTSLTFKTNE